MAKYRLEALLAARRIREDQAARNARAAARALEEAQERARAAEQEVADYRVWRPQEEERRFEKIKGAQLPQIALERYRVEIEGLKLKEVELEEAAQAARAAVVEAEKALAEAKRRQIAASRDREKIDEHRRRWLREELKRQEEAEEKELEDFPSRTSSEDDNAAFASQEDIL